MSANGALAGLGGDELRAVVRAVLRDVLPTALADAPAVLAAAGADPRPEVVSLRTDGDLRAFVSQVATLCEDPAVRAQLRDGRRAFRLAADGGAPPSPTGGGPARLPSASGTTRVERGAVTERTVARAAAEGARLVLGPRAVLTPLARDKARVLGVQIEKER
jgi:hypothetical protein